MCNLGANKLISAKQMEMRPKVLALPKVKMSSLLLKQFQRLLFLYPFGAGDDDEDAREWLSRAIRWPNLGPIWGPMLR